MDELADVYKLHEEWIHIAEVYGAGDYAEDCVHNSYIAIYKYSKPEQLYTENGKVNRSYVFFVIKSQVMNYHQKKVFHEDVVHFEDIIEDETADPEKYARFWLDIDNYTSRNYPLWKRILYKMWRANYTVREMSEITEVSTPTIVKEIKLIKYDIKKKFSETWEEIQRAG